MRIALLFALTLFGAAPGHGAEVYPSRPVHVISGSGSGSTNDFVARVIAQQLTEQLGKQFVVENRPGANGIVGYGYVTKAAPDGYTLSLADTGFTTVPGLQKSLPYDPLKDFTPITEIAEGPQALVVARSLNVSTLKQFIALAQANPGKFNYGSSGVGGAPHLASELFNRAAKVNIAHVPYSGGSGEVVTALLGGHVEMLMSTIPTVLSYVKDGRLRALAVTTDGKRSASMPDVPSMSEAGLPGMAVYVWFGFIGPPGMPRELVSRLHAEVAKAVAVPAVKELLSKQSTEPVGSPPEQFSSYIGSELRRWTEVIRSAGITPQ